MGKLHEAAIKGDLDAVTKIIEHEKTYIDVRDQFENTALILAASSNKLAVIRYLITKKADPNAKNKQGDTAVTKAAAECNLDIVHYLKSNGALVNSKELGHTELTWAAHNDDVSLFRTNRVNLNIKDKYGNTLLMFAAANNSLNVVNYLIQNQVGLNEKGKDGKTVLMIASAKGYLKIVQSVLKQNGVALEDKDNYGNTALLLAILNGHYDVVLYLVSKGANLKAKSNYEKTSLMYAASYGHLKIAQYLVAQNLNIEEKNNGGCTALMEAAFAGELEVVEYLCQQNANFDAADNHGMTPIMYATLNGHHEVVQYLVTQGANPFAKDCSGKTALEWARDFKNKTPNDNRANILFNYLFLLNTNKGGVADVKAPQSPVMAQVSTEAYEALFTRFKDLESEYSKLKQESEQKEIGLRLELDSVARELHTTKSKQVDVATLLKRSNDALVKKNSELQNLCDNLGVEIQSTKINIEQLEVDLKNKDEQCSALNIKVKNLEATSEHSGLLIANLKSQTENLMSEKRALQTQKDLLSNLIKKLESERNTFAQQSKESTEKLSQFNTHIEAATKEQLNRQSEWEAKSKLAQSAVAAEKLAKEELHKANQNLATKVELLERYLAVYNKYGLPPEERAFQEHLRDVKRLLQRSKAPALTCFISYAWEDETLSNGKAANELLQSFLLRLTRDLKEIDVTVLLDIQNLSGDINNWMINNIENCDYVIVIGTERFKKRCTNIGTNVGKEWLATKKKMLKEPNKIIPILYQGDYNTAFPDEIKGKLILDYRNLEQYHFVMAQTTPMGFLRTLFGIYQNGTNQNLQEDYKTLWDKLKLMFDKLKYVGSGTNQLLVQNTPWMGSASALSQPSTSPVALQIHKSFS